MQWRGLYKERVPTKMGDAHLTLRERKEETQNLIVKGTSLIF